MKSNEAENLVLPSVTINPSVKEIEKAIHKSQHCQRNWDLSQTIPEADLELFKTAVTQCPSKQNLAFYRVHFITRRDLIEAVHAKTEGFVTNYETGENTTNPQTLANLLVVFEPKEVTLGSPHDEMRNLQTYELAKGGEISESTRFALQRDRDMAVGIAAGYLNLTAALRGYATGCCACFDVTAVQSILGLQQGPVLLMGVGFSSAEHGRRLHHKDHGFVFPTKVKQTIEVSTVS